MRKSFVFAFFCLLSISSFAQERQSSIIQDLDRRLGGNESPTSNPKSEMFVKRGFINPPRIVTLPENLLPLLAITNTDIAGLQKILSEKDTGIFKLWNDVCGDIKIIDASKDEDCLEYSDYAFGSQYSLDLQRYLNINANLLLSKNRFSVSSNSYQSFQILMDLGNREFSEINKKTKDVVDFSKIKMIDRYGEFQMNKILASDDIKSNRISFSYQAKKNHIFLLRSIFGDTSDWQRETIYAFQLVKFENNIATILWKKISSKWA